MKTDSLFYRLYQDWPQLALELLKLPYSSDSYRFVSEEIKQTGFRIDGLFKPADNTAYPVIFAEVQFQPDSEFYGRFFSEIALYLYRQKPARTWLAMVV
jgi:predicted transposase/invertase (TIGR01784 family)